MARVILSYPLAREAQIALLLAGINAGPRQTLVVLSPDHVEEQPVLSPGEAVALLEKAAAAAETAYSTNALFMGLAALFTRAVEPDPDRTIEQVDAATWARIVALVEAHGIQNTLVVLDKGLVGYDVQPVTRRGSNYRYEVVECSGSLAFPQRVTASEFCDRYAADKPAIEAAKTAAWAERDRKEEEDDYIALRQRATNELSRWRDTERYSEVLAAQEALAGSDKVVLKAAVTALTQARELRERQESARACAEAEARKAAVLAKRTAWIEAHGSDYLKGMRALDLVVQHQYEKERIALELPGWVLTDSRDSEPPGRQPTEREVAHMIKTRETHPTAEPRLYHMLRS